MSKPWNLTINDTLAAAKLEAARVWPGENPHLTAARSEIVAKLAKLPGPNAHVNAHGTGAGDPVIFVGTGDPLMKYTRSPAGAPAPKRR